MRLEFLPVRPRWLRNAHKGRHQWFAWHPVKIWDGKDFVWVWFQTVERNYRLGWDYFAIGKDYL